MLPDDLGHLRLALYVNVFLTVVTAKAVGHTKLPHT